MTDNTPNPYNAQSPVNIKNAPIAENNENPENHQVTKNTNNNTDDIIPLLNGGLQTLNNAFSTEKKKIDAQVELTKYIGSKIFITTILIVSIIGTVSLFLIFKEEYDKGVLVISHFIALLAGIIGSKLIKGS